MPRRVNPLKEKREGQIKEAALKLFSQKGFHNTTVTEISEAAGLGKGTIYWYWKSKEELAFSLVEDMLSAFLRLLEEAVGWEGAFREKFDRLLDEVTALYRVEKEHCRLLWKFRADRHYIFDQEYVSKVTSYYLRMRKAIADLVEQGMEEGALRREDPGKLALAMLGAAEGLELEWLENEEHFDIGEGLKLVFGAMLDGLGARPGSQGEGAAGKGVG
ncbi:TetR/AcrR family transcriptional regulator [Candidatus Solincola tengchongensis]|uniref:TetR/AcrR family transcriptional regulator n=1 Tax=Candidatus Solincola tengchongensis TaxID=2900693 RepID=UPI002579AA21|nr:TetR/AcrR family transcriptional regulator [Candidatus Solincola tengchongensis]